MITLDTAKNCSTANAMLERAVRVASFYGFVPFEEAPTGERAVVSGRQFKLDQSGVRFVRREERRPHRSRRVIVVEGETGLAERDDFVVTAGELAHRV